MMFRPVIDTVLLLLVVTGANAQDSQAINAATRRPEEIEPVTAPFIMPQLKKPHFPDRSFNIVDYGAIGDGKRKNTSAFRKAIGACSVAGGGMVLVPAGKWFTGAIHLKSNVNLHFEQGAELHFSDDPDDYLPVVFTRWAGFEVYNYSPLIYARQCNNIAITGPGKLFGHGDEWWKWVNKGEETIKYIYENQVLQDISPEQRIAGTPEAGLRPQFINPVECKNVLFEGFTISTPGPFWTFDITYCENVIVRGLQLNTFGGPNTDGVNLNSTRNALVEYCGMSVGDDGVCLKSGINEDGWRVGRSTENIVIRHVTVLTSHGGFVIGSDMSGDVRDVYVHDCVYRGTEIGIRLKSNASRGGIVENIYCENITMEDIRHEVIRIETNYGAFMASEHGNAYPVFRNLYFGNITCINGGEAVYMQGTSQAPIENVTLENIDISAARGMNLNWVDGLTVKNVQYRKVENPLTPPNVLYTRSMKKGLEAAYFNNMDLNGDPAFTRIDRQINFYWWSGSVPAPGINTDEFSVRWEGLLKVPEDGTYDIGMEGDDGFRIYLDNELIVDAWENHPPGSFKGVRIELEKERYYDFRIEYFEHLGFGMALLRVKQDQPVHE